MTALTAAVAALFAGCTTTQTPAPGPVENPASFAGRYLDIALVDVKPVAKKMEPPVYPSKWSTMQVNGSATIHFIIDENGGTTQVQCLRASDEAFADAGIAAVKRWLFYPARKNGKPVACAVMQTLDFSVGQQ